MRGADTLSAAGRTTWCDTKLGISRYCDKLESGTATRAESATGLSQRQCLSFSLIICTFHITSDSGRSTHLPQRSSPAGLHTLRSPTPDLQHRVGHAGHSAGPHAPAL